MKIIFFSDLHKDTKTLEKLILTEPNSILYSLGDSELSNDVLNKYKIISVSGNCDKAILDKEIILEVDNKKILLLHGHTMNVKFGLNKLYYYALEKSVDVVIFGHTHKATEIIEDVALYNPGSLRSGQTYILYENKEFKFKRL